MSENSSRYSNLIIPELNSLAKTAEAPVEPSPDMVVTASKGMYGFAKEVERDCLSAVTKLNKYANSLVKAAYRKDEKVASFLGTHAKRSKSRSAEILIKALQEMGPKFEDDSSKTAAAREKGLYGFPRKTAKLGLSLCSDLKDYAGVVSSELHQRKMGKHQKITAFFEEHEKCTGCPTTYTLLIGYPESSLKIAAESVDYWASLEEDDLF